MRGGRRRREDQQVRAAHRVLGAVVHRHLRGTAGRLAQMGGEPAGVLRGQIEHADLVEGPAGARQVVVHVPGDQSRTEDADAAGRSPPAVSRSAASAAEAAVRVALMMELSRQASG